MDVNETIVQALEDIGVDHIFGGSGQVNGSMLLSLKKSKKIKTVIIRNEQAASFMACGYSMYSDKLGVCFATGGPGEFNLLSGLAVAYSDSLPVLAISGFVSKSVEGKGALNESSGRNRTPNSKAIFNATTKKSFIIDDPAKACDILDEAINLAFEGRPGPVHIHVPKDVTTMEVANYRKIQLSVGQILPDDKTISNISEELKEAINIGQNITFLIGYGAIRSHAKQDILNIIDDYQIPFLSTMDAKGYLPENHPLSLGVYGTSGDPGANKYFDKSDIVIALGNSFAQNATFNYKNLYDNKKLIHINIDPVEIGKVYKPYIGLVSDIKPAMIKIYKTLSKTITSTKAKTIHKEKYYDTEIQDNSNKMHPANLCKLISKHLPEKAFLMGDAGSGMLWLNCYTQLNKGQLFQNPGSFGPMASHVNGAIGVKCANPDRTMVCVPGDGAYQMAGFELMTAVQYNIPVIWVILNNGEFNVIKKFLLNLFGEQAFMHFTNPDFVSYAKSCGADGFRAASYSEFEEVFQQALSLNKPVIIDALIDSEVYPPFDLAKV